MTSPPGGYKTSSDNRLSPSYRQVVCFIRRRGSLTALHSILREEGLELFGGQHQSVGISDRNAVLNQRITWTQALITLNKLPGDRGVKVVGTSTASVSPVSYLRCPEFAGWRLSRLTRRQRRDNKCNLIAGFHPIPTRRLA